MTETRQRPGMETGAPGVDREDDSASIAGTDDSSGDLCRCVRCRRPLTSPTSVRLGLGRVCWSAIFREAA